jgi:rubrerythrin
MPTLPKSPAMKVTPRWDQSFEQISKVEKFHESRYRKLINNIADGGSVQEENRGEMALR